MEQQTVNKSLRENQESNDIRISGEGKNRSGQQQHSLGQHKAIQRIPQFGEIIKQSSCQ